MKKAISVVSLLLAIVMIAMCCAACGDKKSEGSEATIIGKWTTEIDFDKVIAASMGQGGDNAELTQILGDALKGITLKMFITFNEDGTCVLSGDEASVNAASEKIKTGMTSALSAMGLSQDMIESAIAQFDFSTLIKGETKKYELNGSKLYMFDDETPKDESKYFEIELSSSELKVTKVVGEETVPESLLPLVLTRA